MIVTDKNREEIIERYAQYLLDNMDFQSLYELAYESIYNSKDLMDNTILEDEILEFYPQLLQN